MLSQGRARGVDERDGALRALAQARRGRRPRRARARGAGRARRRLPGSRVAPRGDAAAGAVTVTVAASPLGLYADSADFLLVDDQSVPAETLALQPRRTVDGSR